MSAALTLAQIRDFTAGAKGAHVDVPCPLCGPDRHSPINRRRKVLRAWIVSPEFITYVCARCDARGFARDGDAQVDPDALERARREAEALEHQTTAERLGKARWLWRRRRPLLRTVGEAYLRSVRRYGGPIPATLGFLQSSGSYPPAIIAAMGIPDEPEPGRLLMRDDAVRGVHVIRLKPDGSKADGEKVKITIGKCLGSPVVLAPMNDLLGLVIGEGLEDVLSVHEATGLGAWAAGGAKRMPALAATVPVYADHVSILEDDDAAGRTGARQLRDGLRERGLRASVLGFAMRRAA